MEKAKGRCIFSGDIIRRPDDKAKAIVVDEIGRAYIVVQWPNGTQSKHHQREVILLIGGKPCD